MLSVCLFLSCLITYCAANVPTYNPTAVPTPVVIVSQASEPIAKHQLVVVPPSGNALIQLTFYDASTTLFSYQVLNTPSTGSLYQLSQVFSNYGYEPKNGALIPTNTVTTVTGSQHRVYYTRPTSDVAGVNQWGSFQFQVTRSTDGVVSDYGRVTIVPPSGAIVGSNFLLSNEGWIITGNKAAVTTPAYEPYSRGALLNYYITGNDDLINVASSSSPDSSLWYFEAPGTYLGNQGIAYGGSFSFTVGAFAGDFLSLNPLSTLVVELECAECMGPIRKGIRLGYNMSALASSASGLFRGDPLKISISLTESGGWVKDSQDVLVPWYRPSQCDVIQVLSRLSKVRILGDYTTWYETVALDNVQIANTKGRLPLCAMAKPDASICLC